MNPAVMMRASLLKENDLFYKKEYDSVQDYDMWERLAVEYGARFHNIPRPLLKYRVHTKSTTTKMSSFQDAFADSVGRREFLRLMGEDAQKYETLFFQIRDWRHEGDADYLREVERLFLLMIDINAVKKIYHQSAFVRQLVELYAHRCRLHRFLGLGVLKMYGMFLLKTLPYSVSLGIFKWTGRFLKDMVFKKQ